MIQVRHLLIGLASSSAFYSGFTPALGLGEISLHSALNQPLNADIQLHDVRDLTSAEFNIKLASTDVFDRAGVERFIFLNDLRFTPVLKGNNSIIRVTSSQPVREPYLNFIVEVSRPNGQLLREYTVLLDPPGTSAYRSTASVPAAPNYAPRPVAKVNSTPVFKAPPVMPSTELGKQYTVASGDSLWKIAGKMRGADGDINQHTLMRDIFALNPQAFSNGNPDRLIAGANLTLPDRVSVPGSNNSPAPEQNLAESDTNGQSPASAAAAGVPVADESSIAEPSSPNATAGTAAGPAPAQTPAAATNSAADQASLASADTAGAQGEQPVVATDADVSIEQLAAQQNRVEQELANRSEENLQMQQGLADLQVQLEQLQAQVLDKDAQLAALQAQLSAKNAASATQTSWFSQNNLLYTGLGGLLLLFLAAFGWSRRKPTEPVTVVNANTQAVDPLESSAPQLRPVAAVSNAPEAKLDPLEGANLYIAYGRLPEAESALRQALDEEPQRTDLRFRLLEVLAQMGSAKAFAAEEAILRGKGFDAERIDALKAGMTPEPEFEDVLDVDLVAPLPVEDKAAPAEQVDNFKLNLDELSLDDDWDQISPFDDKPAEKPTAGKKPAADSDFTMGLDARSPFAEPMLVEEDDWLETPTGEQGFELDEEINFDDLLDADTQPTNVAKLNQALAYIEQGSFDSACDILRELIHGGDELVKKEARALLDKIA
ncbi:MULTISPECIES: FimV/HubP family polar landmark protein [Pseudomonas]|uniref:FimV/HubP family polar landmark protein n=1 Tax=Pseudomonas TaxID=286 RepID=UPI000C11A866|nr:peptidoglycan-binding protein LysM [Pseudomonadaceae bacterium]HCP57342.1 peptidoglycan-binding protein LysM [Pseudomonas sp.]